MPIYETEFWGTLSEWMRERASGFTVDGWQGLISRSKRIGYMDDAMNKISLFAETYDQHISEVVRIVEAFEARTGKVVKIVRVETL